MACGVDVMVASSGVVWVGASAARRDAQAKSRAAKFKKMVAVCARDPMNGSERFRRSATMVLELRAEVCWSESKQG